MPYVDPWASTLQGLSQLGQTLDQSQQMDMQRQQMARQAANDQRQNRLADLQLQSGAMDLAEKQRNQRNLSDLSALYASQANKTVPTTIANPAYAEYQNNVAAGSMGPPLLPGNPSANELMHDSYDMGKAQYPSFSGVAPDKTIPGTRPLTDMEKGKEAQDFLKSKGMFEQLKTIGQTEDITAKIGKEKAAEIQTMMALARKAAAAGNDPKQVIAMIGKATGADVSALEGMDFSPDGEAAVIPLPNGAGTLVSYFDGEKVVTHFAKPETVPAHIIDIPSPDGKRAQKFNYNPTTGVKTPIGEPYAVKSQVANINVNSSTPDQVSADAKAILKGDLAPSALGKRNGHDAKVRAEVRSIDPNFNFTEAETRAKLQKSEKIQDKAGNATILPELINSVKEAGKKLNYSSFAPIGKGGQWWDQLTNNPDYINYAAKRNDIILRIGAVMRENGMTDMAQKLEEDSAPRSMSPKAFDAWASAQMATLEPIMNKYTSQATGKGTPLSTSNGKQPGKKPLSAY